MILYSPWITSLAINEKYPHMFDIYAYKWLFKEVIKDVNTTNSQWIRRC